MEFPLLLDICIHHVDMIRSITGKNFTSVTASSFNPSWSWYRHDAGLKMLLELEGGIPFAYSGDWSDFGRSTCWNGNWRLQGSQGSLHHEKDGVFICRSEKWGRNESMEAFPSSLPPRPDQVETLRRFAEAIRSGTPAETSGADNIRSLAILTAAIKSIRENRRVHVSEFFQQSFSLSDSILRGAGREGNGRCFA